MDTDKERRSCPDLDNEAQPTAKNMIYLRLFGACSHLLRDRIAPAVVALQTGYFDRIIRAGDTIATSKIIQARLAR